MKSIQGYDDPKDAQVNPAVVHTRDDQKRQTEGVREARMAKNQDADKNQKVDKSLQAIVPRVGQADATHAPDGHERRSPVAIAPTQAGQSSAIPKLEKAEAKVTAQAEENPPKDFMPGFADDEAKRADETDEQHKERTKHRRKH